MICLHCQSLDLKSNPKHALVGIGKCKLDSLPGVFVNIKYDRNCDKFKKADDSTISKREEWAVKNSLHKDR